MKEKITREEWSKLWIAKINDWTVSLVSEQHVLGWLNFFPPREFEGSLTDLTDQELLDFKHIGKVLESALKNTFNTDWINYRQSGNTVKRLHIQLIPRYASDRDFNGFKFTDNGWGHPVKLLELKDLPEKETVFEIVEELRKYFRNLKLEKYHIEVFQH